MDVMLNSRIVKISFATIVFCILNLSLYWFTANYSHLFPFQTQRYVLDAFHYLPDPRINGGQFEFLRAWGQYDAQWFLSIAQNGYPFHPIVPDLNSQSAQSGLAYAFFPLYPVLIGLVNFCFRNIELSAFILTNILMVAGFLSLIYLVSRQYNLSVGLKSAFLLYTYPFSIFYRSYFSEGLFLFLIIWLTYFLLRKKYFPAAVFLGLANITRGSGLLFNLFFIYLLFAAFRRKTVSHSTFLLSAITFTLPLISWSIFNYFQTGNAFFYYHTLSAWFVSPFPFAPFLYNPLYLLKFSRLPFHLFHNSQVEVITAISSFTLLIASQKRLPWQMWSLALFLWLTPIVTHDLMSFSRYACVLFPLFVYLGKTLGDKTLIFTLVLFTLLLFITSLLFVNWYWIG